MSKKIDVKFGSNNNIKTNELNHILDKISIRKELSSREREFLDNYDNVKELELKDFRYLSLLDIFYVMSKIKKIIICDIKDKQGRISEKIYSIDYNHDDCKIILGLKHGIYTLTDNYLYKLTYEFKHDNYSLDIEGEYKEKIEIEK